MHRRVRQELTPLRTLDLDLEEHRSAWTTFLSWMGLAPSREVAR